MSHAQEQATQFEAKARHQQHWPRLTAFCGRPQDARAAFKAAACALNSKTSTAVTLKTRAGALSARSLSIVVFVSNNAVSQLAFQMAKQLVVSEEDCIFVMHTVNSILERDRAQQVHVFRCRVDAAVPKLPG